MNKNIIKTLFISFVLVFSMAFTNMIDVRAGYEDDIDSEYAICTYEWKDLISAATETTYSEVNVVYKFGYKIYQNDKHNYVVETKLGCSESGTTNEKNCSIHNRSNLDEWIIEYYEKEKIPSENEWKCLPKIFIDYDGAGPFEDHFKVNIGTKSGQCWMCLASKPLTKEAFKDDSSHGVLDVNDKSGGSNMFIDTTTGKIISSEGIDTDDNNDDIDAGWILNWANNDKPEDSTLETTNCDLIPDSITNFLKNLFFIIQIIGIILLVVLSMVEFVKALTGENEDGIKQALKNTFKRIILVVILLILPSLIIWILNIVNDNSYVTKNGKHVIGADGNPICKKDQ